MKVKKFIYLRNLIIITNDMATSKRKKKPFIIALNNTAKNSVATRLKARLIVLIFVLLKG